MLKNCPKLQSLELDLLFSFDVEDVLPDSHFVVPECLTSHFTKCYLKHYGDTKSDLQFAKYIMENSTSLLSLTIHSASSNPLKQLEELQDLALCPRRSASCQLSFSFE
uniref:FBD domain-containing protein n=1 Tax=Lotus japonicus TaxID=34305 RepID=I3S998_LOTJA|nr:unknown [Lotus japonicus]